MLVLSGSASCNFHLHTSTNSKSSRTCVCVIASHTISLLQDLQLDEPMTLRVLLGGPLANQLGLSRNHRHTHLRAKFGQLQLSKVRSNQNLATCLADNSASGLERLLLKLKMCAQPDNARALPTVRCAAPASFRKSPGSFLVGMVSKTPAMEQLLRIDCRLELSDHEFSGKELVTNFADPKLSRKELEEKFLLTNSFWERRLRRTA